MDSIEKINKTREVQEKEFKDVFSHYATPNCPHCFGRGWGGWHNELQQLIPCDCIYKNIDKIKELRKSAEKEIIPC